MKGDEGCSFTLHPQTFCVYRHFRRKDEGMKGKNAFRFEIFYAIKIFLKSFTYFYINTATNIFFNKEAREQNTQQIFLFRQVGKAP